MRASERCYANIAGYEGFVPHPYLDNHGNVTIGYGSCYYPDGRRVTMKDNVVSRETAWKMMTLTVDRMAARPGVLDESLVSSLRLTADSHPQ